MISLTPPLKASDWSGWFYNLRVWDEVTLRDLVTARLWNWNSMRIVFVTEVQKNKIMGRVLFVAILPGYNLQLHRRCILIVWGLGCSSTDRHHIPPSLMIPYTYFKIWLICRTVFTALNMLCTISGIALYMERKWADKPSGNYKLIYKVKLNA